jgi:O-acetyl-ADP-ribose deacetylase (regulator of RNase III)
MIKEVTGDILLTDAQAIAHGVAPSDHFDSGLALSLRKDYPSMYKDFRHYCHIAHPKPGETWMWGGVGGVRIINLLTQEPAKGKKGHPGKATLHNVSHSLKELAKTVKKEKIKSLALPRLATGVGGLDWEDVRPLVYDRLAELDIPIYVYTTFTKGVKAEEN